MAQDDYMRSAASNLVNMQSFAASMIQQDRESGAAPGQGTFASLIAPTDATPLVKAQIRALPTSSTLIIYIHLDYEMEEEGATLMCVAHNIKKEHGSNGLSLPESDGFDVTLANCAMLDASNSVHAAKFRILLGTLAKACLEPMGGMTSPMSTIPPIIRSQMGELYSPCRPAKVLFQTRGQVEMLRDDLKEMGIENIDVAEQNLIQSCELYASSQNMPNPDCLGMEDNIDLLGDPRAMANRIIEQAEGPYVSEEHESLGGWTPPSEPGDFPRKWYARPPSDPDSYRPTGLCGWRTNLERAVLGEDEDVVKRITSKYGANDVREYVECRMLLTKMAQRGMVNACKLLLDDCGASVEGAQAPGEGWWKDIQNQSGNYYDLTPLHQAARNGKLATVRLLLDYGANVNQIDRAEIKASPLHHAVSMGEIDCVRLLCERGADHTYVGLGGEALDISEMVGRDGDVHKQRVQTKVQQILRQHDTRCSHCRQPSPPKKCPCKKERYCDSTCQRGRWKLHKKYHNEVVDGS